MCGPSGRTGHGEAMSILRVANCSGFWGDRLSAAEEMVHGGPIDVLTGDYLAELTMAILARKRLKDPRAGFVPTFLEQMERVLAACLERGIKIVANAGGLNPRGLAAALLALSARLGVQPKIAFVDGDDVLDRLGELQAAGERLCHLDRGTPLSEAGSAPVTANAYLGGWGICEALQRGADIVVTGRVTDAALVVGPAAWHFGWRRDDWDRLAGAVAAGHVLECSAQATGGNYAFWQEVPKGKPGFPIAELSADGSFVVTKHAGTGGLVSVGTVTAQLLYEIQGPRYLNPDVTARFDALRLEQVGPDRVRVFGARGEPPPPTLKLCINHVGGWKNQMTVLLGGLAIEEKARLVEEQLFAALGGRAQLDRVDVRLERLDREDPRWNEESLAHLKIAVTSRDRERVGRRFSSAVVELALSSVPGFSARTPPEDATPYFVYWPALLDRRHVHERVTILFGEEATIDVPPGPLGRVAVRLPADAVPRLPPSPAVRAPLGRVFGARSGDKGGDASLGIWARDDRGWAWLRDELTVEKLAALCPDLAAHPIERHALPNLRALSFVVHGLLGEGVAASTRADPQAKTLGEYVRAKWVELPEALLPPSET